MSTLRPYQRRHLDALCSYMPSGAGKALDRLLADQMPTPLWVHARAQEPVPMVRYDVGGALREVAALPVVLVWIAPEMRGHGFSQPVELDPATPPRFSHALELVLLVGVVLSSFVAVLP